MNVEDRLRSALRQESEGVPVGDDRWETINTNAATAGRRRRGETVGVGVLAIAAAVALVVGLVSVVDRDNGAQRVRVGGSPDTTSAPTFTSTTVAPTAPTPFWDETFSDPRTAAATFARDYIGMSNPSVGPYVDSAVSIRSNPDRGPFSSVVVRKRDDGRYEVQWMRSRNLLIESPADGPPGVTSPVTVRGRSRAFEATFAIQVRDLGQLAGQLLAEKVVTGGGGSGTLEPFTATVSFTRPQSTRGALILLVRSAEDGSITEASAQPIAF